MRISTYIRRTFCLLTVLCLLASSALAVTVDISSLTDEELVTLLNEVNDAIVSRGISKTAKLPKGAYIGGKDITAGRYIFTSLATGDEWGNVTVYSEEGSGKQLLWEIVSAPENGEAPETIFVTLNEGDQLKSGVGFSLTIMSGAIFQ